MFVAPGLEWHLVQALSTIRLYTTVAYVVTLQHRSRTCMIAAMRTT